MRKACKFSEYRRGNRKTEISNVCWFAPTIEKDNALSPDALKLRCPSQFTARYTSCSAPAPGPFPFRPPFHSTLRPSRQAMVCARPNSDRAWAKNKTSGLSSTSDMRKHARGGQRQASDFTLLRY